MPPTDTELNVKLQHKTQKHCRLRIHPKVGAILINRQSVKTIMNIVEKSILWSVVVVFNLVPVFTNPVFADEAIPALPPVIVTGSGYSPSPSLPNGGGGINQTPLPSVTFDSDGGRDGDLRPKPKKNRAEEEKKCQSTKESNEKWLVVTYQANMSVCSARNSSWYGYIQEEWLRVAKQVGLTSKNLNCQDFQNAVLQAARSAIDGNFDACMAKAGG
jgi:hypothetical protein